MVFKYLKKRFFYNRKKRSYLGDRLTIAAKSHQKAAEQGHVTSQYHLGTFYREGKGVRQDLATAINWYQKAAEGACHLPVSSCFTLPKWKRC